MRKISKDDISLIKGVVKEYQDTINKLNLYQDYLDDPWLSYEKQYISYIDQIMQSLKQEHCSIIFNEFFSEYQNHIYDKYWYLDYYSSSYYSKIKAEAIYEFVKLLKD